MDRVHNSVYTQISDKKEVPFREQPGELGTRVSA